MSGWRTPPAAVEESRITETLRTQVAVVGLGHAGTAALRALAEAGVPANGIEQMQQGRHRAHQLRSPRRARRAARRSH